MKCMCVREEKIRTNLDKMQVSKAKKSAQPSEWCVYSTKNILFTFGTLAAAAAAPTECQATRIETLR